MHPEMFLKQHITAALLADGASPEVAGGGWPPPLSSTANAQSRAARAPCSLIACWRPGGGYGSTVTCQSVKRPGRGRGACYE